MTLEPGIERTEEFTAEGRLLTDVRGTLPVKVLSTPGMIAMMERCASVLSWENLDDGRKLRFDVDVRDGERTIGVGTHERRVIDRPNLG
jgi:fluoroacetyl-CoA thioesterase